MTLQDEWEGVPRLEETGNMNESIGIRFTKYFDNGQLEDGRVLMDDKSL